MTENDHITSALLAVVIVIIICYRPSDRVKITHHITSALLAVVIVIIICYRPSDRVKIDRQDIFN